MELQRVLSHVRKAVDDYEMIQDGDRIAVGISGGKDSLTLLMALAHLRKFYSHPFELYAVTVDVGFDNIDFSKIQSMCNELEVPYFIIKTDIYDIVFNIRKESNPCALCSKMRKGALNDYLKENKINKLAYAHHMDDVVDTMFLSLIYEGRFHTFSPVTYLDRTDITVIRPLVYIKEADVKGFVNKYSLPVVKSPCPADKHTKREAVKEYLSQINLDAPGVKERMFTAIRTSKIDRW